MPSSYRSMLTQPLPMTPPYTDAAHPHCAPEYPSGFLNRHGPMVSENQPLGPASDACAKRYTNRYSVGPYHQHQYREYESHPASAYGRSLTDIKIPMLSSMQPRDRPMSEYHQSQPKQSKPAMQPKEEKPIGGVAAHLDYEMEQMVDFVSESAQGIVNPNHLVPPALRKYVSQVLSSTRLPSSTILYGLYYLARRMTGLSREGRYSAGSGQIYRMLTTALLLGSKFLDDNTFQNRSWSEVSNIPVQELNTLELEWLTSMEWNLHIDLNDPQGFKLWDLKWKRWQAMKVELSMESLKLNTLNPNIQRQPSISKRISPTTPYPSSYYEPTYSAGIENRLPGQWTNPRYEAPFDNWSASRPSTHYSPPSAPPTGPTTPEWYGRGWYPNEYKSYGSSTANTPASAQSFQSFAQQTSYQKPYSQQYTPSGWTGHNPTCGCGYCVPHHDPFYNQFQYRSQTVAG